MKKILILLTAFLLMVNSLHAVQTWDGTSSGKWVNGSGTEADPYLIETPAHLAYLSARVKAGNTYEGVYFLQTDDFDLNSKTWTPIGTDTYKFAGVYDGGDKKISKLKNAIFGYICSATIKNLTLNGAEVTNTSTLCKNTEGNSHILNCHCTGTIKVTINTQASSTSEFFAGGIIHCSGGASLTMTACSNQAIMNVTFPNYSSSGNAVFGYVGGFLGYSSCSTLVSQSINACNMTIAPTGYKYAGDFIGIAGSGNIIEKSYSTPSANMPDGYFGVAKTSNTTLIRGCYARGTYIFSTGCITQTNAVCCYLAPRSSDVMTTTIRTSGGSNINYNLPYYWQSESYCFFYAPNNAKIGLKDKSILSELNMLGDYFTMDLEGINDGYPILKWQAGIRYNINATCDPARGTVKGGGEYAMGNTVTLTATPKSGSTFVGWSDGNTDNPRTITVEGDANYIAQFTKSAYTIYVNQDGTSNIE